MINSSLDNSTKCGTYRAHQSDGEALKYFQVTGFWNSGYAWVYLVMLVLGSIWHLSAQAQLPINNSNHILDITGSGSALMSLPSDVVANKRQICVVDSGNHRLGCFKQNGSLIRTIGSKGSKPGQFLDPVGIGVDKRGRLYVADTGNYRVQVFTAKGRLHKVIPIELDGRPLRPVDVLPSNNGKTIYVSTKSRHQILVLDKDGQRMAVWGRSGTNYGEFRYPATMDFASDNRIVVVDILNARLQVLTKEGKFSIQVGEWGVKPGQLFRPKGVVTNERGDMYVSDSYIGLVSVFSDTGKFQGVLGRGEEEYRLETPVGMAIDSGNRLYVAEMLANKVSVYDLDAEE